MVDGVYFVLAVSDRERQQNAALSSLLTDLVGCIARRLPAKVADVQDVSKIDGNQPPITPETRIYFPFLRGNTAGCQAHLPSVDGLCG